MKVIELLNKIANGETPPKKIKYYDRICFYDESKKDYFVNGVLCLCEDYIKFCLDDLNREVEIIEEDKKIEKIKWNEKSSYNQEVDTKKLHKILLSRTEQLKQGINEIIEVLDKCG